MFNDVNSFPGQNPAGVGYVADGCTYAYVIATAVMMDRPVAGFGVIDVQFRTEEGKGLKNSFRWLRKGTIYGRGLIRVAAGLVDTSFSYALLEILRHVVKKQLQAKLVRMKNVKEVNSMHPLLCWLCI